MVNSAVALLNVEEAKKILNIEKFDAKELNEKFRFQMLSVARGMGGSVSRQKRLYTAWEYLNRMLAREAQSKTEDVLQKADKTSSLFEQPKKLDMIPIRLSDPARKGSLIIEYESGSPIRTDTKSNLMRKSSVLPNNFLRSKRVMIGDAGKGRVDKIMENQKGRPKLTSSRLKEFPSNETPGFSRKEATMPKLAKGQMTLPNKFSILTGKYDQVEKLLKRDQQSMARWIQWKERADEFLGDSKRGKTTDQVGSEKDENTLKQPRQVVYSEGSDGNLGSRTTKIKSEMFSREVFQEKPNSTELRQETTGRYTSERIRNWIKSTK